MEINIEIDAGRLLYGLSRIGYTTASALCDIIDNSVRAGATKINLVIIKEREELADSRKNNVRDYVIIDNGCGMDDAGLKEALKLGSSDEHYEDHSLSKFGLGLKSAAFSQSDVLHVISSTDGTSFLKYEISLPEVIARKKYFAEKKDIDDADKQIISKYLSGSKGTIIRLSQVRKVNHPSVKATIKELNLRIGVIYYYFIKESNIEIYIGDNKIKPIDPLFVEEANINGTLNENEWDGKTVKWIEKPKEIVLDDENQIKATLEITQLPYPPVFRMENPGEGKDAEIREKYLIGSSNYGFYVYRNKRLIAWAHGLQGIIPYDQDYFAFRGRILIDDSADDYFNIDVKKSNITLSDEAFNIISDLSQESKAKSKKAWLNAGRRVTEASNVEPNEIANRIILNFEQIDLLPGDEELEEGELKERVLSIKQDMEKKVETMALMLKQDKGEESPTTQSLTEDEKDEAIRGSKNPTASKIFRVSSVPDNLLWEPYYDTDKGDCVRINKYHRFGRYIYEDNIANKDLQIVFELLLLQLAESELYSYKKIGGYKYEELKKILTEFRRISSEFLANMTRKLEDVLPPKYGKINYD
ncbi:MAG TPA: ATP-binding protein [Cyclobacteriaceae bacterium]|nr:ATP-binding protein [Cyclobacteriaceae bacterium]HMX00940.1 ATP-binding protein [Cyclobacteriaceae bacterium]HMX50017.1 ATP-binding protein [Cyclobacteriaceae bacterium]HMY93744.1 ATP-binding protein [Cyclobacteriaceae bacterium]HNA12601.1 ATP-binding protein [Cyclobacteriaceae bacterium]